MRALILPTALLLQGLPGHAQAPLKLSGDFDGDGQPDRLERQVALGAWKLVVTLAAAPDAPHLVMQGTDYRQGSAPLEVGPPGDYKIEIDGVDARRSIATDLFVYGRRDEDRRYRVFFWQDNAFVTGWMVEPD